MSIEEYEQDAMLTFLGKMVIEMAEFPLHDETIGFYHEFCPRAHEFMQAFGQKLEAYLRYFRMS